MKSRRLVAGLATVFGAVVLFLAAASGSGAALRDLSIRALPEVRGAGTFDQNEPTPVTFLIIGRDNPDGGIVIIRSGRSIFIGRPDEVSTCGGNSQWSRATMYGGGRWFSSALGGASGRAAFWLYAEDQALDYLDVSISGEDFYYFRGSVLRGGLSVRSSCGPVFGTTTTAPAQTTTTFGGTTTSTSSSSSTSSTTSSSTTSSTAPASTTTSF